MKAAAQGAYEPPSWTVPEAPAAAGDPAADPTGVPGDPAPAPAPTSTKTMTTSGCSASPSGLGSGGSVGLFGLALAAVFAARRRRSS